MLKTLHVKNLALVRDADIAFRSGLNVLTGETGAGKSILMESIVMGLGGRVRKEMLRDDSTALIELIFDTDPEERGVLSEAGIPVDEDGQVIISRRITEGRSTLRIGGETFPASFLKERAGLLVDIYGQNDHVILRYPNKQLLLIDSFGGEPLKEKKEAYRNAYEKCRACDAALSALRMDEGERSRRADLLSYEISQIENAALKEGEDEELEAVFRKMRSAEKLLETMQQVHSLTGYEENGAAENVGMALRAFSRIRDLDEELAPIGDLLADIDALLGDFGRAVADYTDSLSFDEEEFAETERRLNEINRLKTKYGRTIPIILESLEERRKEYDALENYDAALRRAEKQSGEARMELGQRAEELTKERLSAAERFDRLLTDHLSGLNFQNVVFRTDILPADSYLAEGADSVRFMISTNVGERVRPLAEVASGGELSRIMLGIKSVFAQEEEAHTLIFDEIDTGISGRTAQKVAEKLRVLSEKGQVICVTHLPQIAAMADHHLMITKEVREGMSTTKIETIEGDEITKEVARMIGGAEVTVQTNAAAEEMIRFGRKK